jgi:hypothetical protein
MQKSRSKARIRFDAYLLDCDQSCRSIKVKDFEHIRKIIGGTIEPFFPNLRTTNSPRGWVFMMDEAGRPKDLPINYYASELAEHEIVGKVVMLKRDDYEKIIGD